MAKLNWGERQQRPYPPVNFINSDSWQPYTRLTPANEVHEWVNKQILIDSGNIYNPDDLPPELDTTFS